MEVLVRHECGREDQFKLWPSPAYGFGVHHSLGCIGFVNNIDPHGELQRDWWPNAEITLTEVKKRVK